MASKTKEPEFSVELPFSYKLGKLEATVTHLKQQYRQLWLETELTFPEFHRTYTPKEQRELEADTTKFLNDLAENQSRQSNDGINRNDVFNDREQEVERFCQLAGLYMDKQYAAGFNRSTKGFMEKAKKFDSSLKPENIYQALRNIWIMNSLQIFLSQEMDCSRSMFAYSMLYPYSDNINDDISLPDEEKLKMNWDFKQWLEGEQAPYQNDNERKIYLLVKMIEEQFPRRDFPGVFQSLLAIFNAQIKSLIQQKANSNGNGADILDISLEKGGASVLADGYLIRGVLKPKQEDFCFGYGAFLQLADDIQDLVVDKQNGHLTLFSQLARNYCLDKIANKLFNYILKVVNLHLSSSTHQRLRELILRNCCFMVQEAIGKNFQFYSKKYLNRIERHFPFSFSYFKMVKKRLKAMILHNA